MGIKCSVFGHDFGETTVERDREEQGNEVVSTIREVETCRRCGETRVVSENTEVTTIKTPEDVATEEEATADESDGQPDATPAATDIVDAEAGEPVAEADPTNAEPSDETAQYESPAEDDGVILEDDDEDDPVREPGEWPESTDPEESTRTDTGSAGQTTTESEDVEPSVGPDLSVDVTTDDGSSSAEPAEGSSTDDEAEVWSSTDPDLGDAQQAVEDGDTGTNTIVDGQFRCTECGFTTPVESSSLREGDYCPDCHQGMLVIEAQ